MLGGEIEPREKVLYEQKGGGYFFLLRGYLGKGGDFSYIQKEKKKGEFTSFYRKEREIHPRREEKG